MNISKSNLAKSKSSNVNTAAKHGTRKNNKKSKSNAEIKIASLRKRGAQEYIEKKETNMSLNEPTHTAQRHRMKCTPRAGKKRFLTSVLNILSPSIMNDPNMASNSNNNTNEPQRMKLDDFIDECISTRKKQKHRKKIEDFQSDMDDFKAQQSKNELNRNPSDDSEGSGNEPEDIKWSEFLPRLVPRTNSEIEEEKKFKTQGLRTHINNATDENQLNKNESKFYNLFIDLLETTFSVYNAEADKAKTIVANASKNSLEIDMSLPLMHSKEKFRNIPDDDSADVNQSKKFGAVNPYDNWDKRISDDYDYDSSTIPLNTSNRKRKLKSNSFVNYNKKKNVEPMTRSFVHQRSVPNGKKLLRKDKKQTLLNMFKQQLSKSTERQQEPQNFFEALQLMARNKRQRTIHFEKTPKEESAEFRSMFNRQSLISPKPSRKFSKAPMRTSKSFRSSHANAYKTYIPDYTKYMPDFYQRKESRHSLKVFAFDVETPKENNIGVPNSLSRSGKVLREASSNEGTLHLSDSSSVCEVINLNDTLEVMRVKMTRKKNKF